jgi:hypothetical protein
VAVYDFLPPQTEKKMPKYPEVTVKLIGQDGNVFNLIGLVNTALKKTGHTDAAREFTSRAFGSHSYSEVLGLVQEYVAVK